LFDKLPLATAKIILGVQQVHLESLVLQGRMERMEQRVCRVLQACRATIRQLI